MPRVRPLDAGVAVLVLGAVAVVVLTSRGHGGSPIAAPTTPAPVSASPVVTALPFPTATGPLLAAPTFAVGVPGPVDGSCVEVADRPRLRSGQFVVADLQRYRRVWTRDRTADKTLFVTPLHIPPDGAGLRVTATLLHNGDALVRTLAGDPAAYVRAPGYFTLDTTLPRAGRWRLDLSSGADHGCFLLDLPLTP